MPALLGLPALFRFLISLVPLAIGYVASFLGRLATKTGVIATALVAALLVVFNLAIQWLGSVISGSFPQEVTSLLYSVLPDGLDNCITIIMSMKIAVFVFDLKDRFLALANKVL